MILFDQKNKIKLKLIKECPPRLRLPKSIKTVISGLNQHVETCTTAVVISYWPKHSNLDFFFFLRYLNQKNQSLPFGNSLKLYSVIDILKTQILLQKKCSW